MKIFVTLISILAILILLLIIDFRLGERAQRKKTKRKNFPIRNSDFTLFTDGTELFPSLFDTVKQATSHVHILFYTIKTDSISKEFLDLLKTKANEGVEVRLMLDWLGSIKIRKKIRKKLKNAGVQFAFCQLPSFPYLFYSLQERNHRKIAIIDGKIGFMGGFNIGKDYVHTNFKLSPWRDYHIKMTGEGVDDLQREFLIDWKNAFGVNLLQDPIYFPKQEKGPARHQVIPTQGVYLEEILCDLIRNCKTSLVIGTPYFIPSNRVMQELLAAIDRNVKITILLPNKADHPFVKEASFRYLRILLKNGVKVFQYMNGFFHGKLIIADETIAVIGSANFDKRSFFLNHELNCCIYDFSLIKEIEDMIQIDINESKELLLKDLTNQSIGTFIKECVARPLSPFL